MLIVEIFRYLKRRADKRPVYLKNFVDQGHHHGTRTIEPSVEIIIPTRDKFELLHACIESVIDETSYKNYSITIVNNQSIEAETLSYLAQLQSRGVKIIDYPHKFNYSAICNLAASESTAEYLCFLNNDTEVIEPDWLSFMVDHAVQPGVGVVGSKLIERPGQVQHAGIAYGLGGIAANVNWTNSIGFDPSKCFEVSAVSFACVLTSKNIFEEVGLLDETFAFGLNDVDFCIRINLARYANLVCCQSIIQHLEFGSRPRITSVKGSASAALATVRLMRKHAFRQHTEIYFDRSQS